MNQSLPSGHIYGQIINRADIAGFTLSESAYLPDTHIARHVHEQSYFCILLEGSYRENYGKKTRECRPSTVVFHPPREVHSTHFGDNGGRLFRFEIKPQWLERIGEYSMALSGPADFYGGSLAWLNSRLYKEFREIDDVSPLAIEGLILEIVAEMARRTANHAELDAPRWLKTAGELLRDQCGETLVFSSIAESVGVHPVHLARVFRRFHGCTLGEYVRRVRIDAATHKLIASDAPLVEVAITCGFSDQSHFSKTFKHATGMTPARYRAIFRSR